MTPRKDSEKDDANLGMTPPNDPAPGAESADVSPAEQAKKLQAEKEELLNTLVRRQADFENYRKRVEKERHHDRSRGVEVLIEKLLPVLDAFERALAAHGDPAYEEYRKGFELIDKQLRDVLAKQGLERIEAEGKEFNPHLHHAVERVESADYPDGAILSVFQAGYKFHDKVLRPAMVRVAVHPATLSREASREN
ncbi:MAG: nucleotide exchange factor GrpE [Candidatus Acidiferrales bacterium]